MGEAEGDGAVVSSGAGVSCTHGGVMTSTATCPGAGDGDGVGSGVSVGAGCAVRPRANAGVGQICATANQCSVNPSRASDALSDLPKYVLGYLCTRIWMNSHVVCCSGWV